LGRRLCEEGQLAWAYLSLFVIDSLKQSGYTLAAPQGVSGKRSLKNQQSAISNQVQTKHSAVCDPQPTGHLDREKGGEINND
jgi:hypothetical protein